MAFGAFISLCLSQKYTIFKCAERFFFGIFYFILFFALTYVMLEMIKSLSLMSHLTLRIMTLWIRTYCKKKKKNSTCCDSECKSEAIDSF